MERHVAKPAFSVDLLAKSTFNPTENNVSLSSWHSSLYYPGKTTFGGSMSHKRMRLNDRGISKVSRSIPPKKKLQHLHQTVRRTIQQNGCDNCQKANLLSVSSESRKNEEKETRSTTPIIFTKAEKKTEKDHESLKNIIFRSSTSERIPIPSPQQKQALSITGTMSRTFNFSSPLCSSLESKAKGQRNAPTVSKSFTFCSPGQPLVHVDAV